MVKKSEKEIVASKHVSKVVKKVKSIFKIDELINERKAFPPLNFIWSGIKEGSVGFILGPSKTGKTTFAECLAMSIAAGHESFLEKKIHMSNIKVLFISLEENWLLRTERNEKQRKELKNKVIDNYLLLKDDYPTYLFTDDDYRKIEELIIESEAKLVIIDSLSRMYTGQIEESGTAKGVMKRVRDLAASCKITLIIIHHSPKNNGKTMSVDSIAGSRILAQEADFCFGVNRTPRGERYIKEIFFRYAKDSGDEVTTIDINDNQWIIKGLACSEIALIPQQQDGRVKTKNAELIYKFIQEEEQKDSNGIAHSGLLKELIKPGVMAKPTFYENVEKLISSGQIIKTENETYVTNPNKES